MKPNSKTGWLQASLNDVEGDILAARKKNQLAGSRWNYSVRVIRSHGYACRCISLIATMLATLVTKADFPALTNYAAVTNRITANVSTNLPPATNLITLAPIRTLPECSTEATNAYRAMNVRAGFRLQLAATDPLITDPVAITFDANGRLYVAEQPSGSQGRIKILDDDDGDGIFDRSSIFADNIAAPTALYCYGDGVFVAAGRKIIFLAHTNGSDIGAIEREIFTGFAITNAGPGEGLNNFTWSADGLIHVAAGNASGNISCAAIATTKPLALLNCDFAFNPKTLEMIAEPGGNSRGVSFDNTGRRFICNTTRPIIGTICDVASTAQNPIYHWPQLTADLAPQPWFIFPPKRAEPSINNSSNKVARAQPAKPVRLSRASSLLVHRGETFGNALMNTAFVTDAEAGIISRLQLRANGFFPVAERPRTEAATEFLSSRDRSFRPLQIVSGPDGSLYVVDIARTDLSETSYGGRIWRILPPGAMPQRPPQLAALDTSELVELLANPSGWIRDTASRLLIERTDAGATTLLQNQLLRSSSAVARLLSLRVLQGLNVLTEPALITALRDRDESVREAAAQLAGQFIRDGAVSNLLWNQIARAATDASLRVRLKAALTLGLIERPAVVPTLAGMIRAAPDQRVLQFAVLTAAQRREDALLLEFLRDPRVMQIPGGREFMLALATMAGMTSDGRAEEILRTLEVARFNEADAYAIAGALGEGLLRSGRDLAAAAPQGTAQRFSDAALQIARSPGSPELRAEAIRFLATSGRTSRDIGDWTLALLSPGEPQVVESAVIETLSSLPDPAITSAFIQRWRGLSATSQSLVIASMLERFDRTMALMTALEERRIPATALTDVQVNLLREHPDSHTAARALKFFGPVVLSGLAERYAPLRHMSGSAARGQQLFTARCAGCHRFGNEGTAFGPDLDDVARRGRAKLIEDILEPGREIRAGYNTQVLQRRNSLLLLGRVSDTGRNTYVVRRPGQPPMTLPSAQVAAVHKLEGSLMPQDAAAGMSASALADLLEFLAP